MKNPNIEIVESYFGALAKGDLAALGNLFDDDIVWHQPGQGSLSGTYRGKENVFALFGKFMQISEGSFRIQSVDAIMANGDQVAATLKFSAEKKSGAKISMGGVDLMRIEYSKIKEVTLFSQDQNAEDAFWL